MSTPLEIVTGLSASTYEYSAIATTIFMNGMLYMKLYGRDSNTRTAEQNITIGYVDNDIQYYQNLANNALNSANEQLDISGYNSDVQARVDEIQTNKNIIDGLPIIYNLYPNNLSRALPNVSAMNAYTIQVNSYINSLLGLYEPIPTSNLIKTYEAAVRADSIAAQYAASYAADFAAATSTAIAANNSTAATQAAADTQFASTKAAERYTSAIQNSTNATSSGSTGTFTFVLGAQFQNVTLTTFVSSAETASTSASASNTTAQNALSAYLAPAPSPAPAPAPSPSPSPAPAPSPSPAPAPAPSPSSADPHAHNSISVNFNVLIDADSNISVLGETAPTVTNVVTATYNMPVTALYDPDNNIGLIEMWEPADVPGDIKVTLAGISDTGVGNNINPGVYETAIRRLAVEFQKVLVNSLDCSQAIPYNDAKYAGVSEYTLQRDFGRLALGTFAHYMFGHVDATVAITNDVAFVKNMLSIDAGEVDETSGGPAARYNAWRFKDYVNDTSAPLYDWQGAIDYVDPSDANLAQRLAHSIYLKGADGVPSLVSTATNSSLAYIVKQVIGQDAQRTKMVDGSERTRDYHQLLRFYAGDIIYVNIKLKKPSVTVGGGQAGVSATSLGDAYDTEDEQNYTIKIELA
jgi:hypothetical protein